MSIPSASGRALVAMLHRSHFAAGAVLAVLAGVGHGLPYEQAPRSLILSADAFAPSTVSFHGSTADGRHLYSSHLSVDQAGAHILQNGVIIEPFQEDGRDDHVEVVWVSAAPVALDEDGPHAHQAERQWRDFVASFASTPSFETQSQDQHVLSSKTSSRLLYADHLLAMFEVPVTQVAVFFGKLSPFVTAVIHPTDPVLTSAKDASKAAHRLAKLLPLTFDPLTDILIKTLSAKELEADICTLSGEDAPATWTSRHSFSTGIRKASAWAKAELEATGANCSYFDYAPKLGFAPAIVCALEAQNPEKPRVILSGHLDSRGTFGQTTAPGADDDGSGSAMVLSVARALFRSRVKLSSPTYLVLWTGEEQGLWGSRALSQKLRAESVDIALMIHADMIAYRKPGEPQQLALPNRKFTPEAAYLLGNVSTLYTPELSVGTTKACCSDQQSFFDADFPAIWAFERHAGDAGIADPSYHDSSDRCRREGFDPDQAVAISRALYATLLTTAGYRL